MRKLARVDLRREVATAEDCRLARFAAAAAAAAAVMLSTRAWAGRLRRRGPPPCLLLEMPDALLEHILAQLPAWHIGHSAAVCRAFSEHYSAATEMRAAHLNVTLLSRDKPEELHLHEVVGAWHWLVDDEQLWHEDGDTLMLLEHQPSRAALCITEASNGYIDLRESGAPWQTVYSCGDLEQMAPEAYPPWPTPTSQSQLSARLWSGRRHHGCWRFDVRKQGVDLICTDDTRENPIPSLLSANGAVLKRRVAVGFVDALVRDVDTDDDDDDDDNDDDDDDDEDGDEDEDEDEDD